MWGGGQDMAGAIHVENVIPWAPATVCHHSERDMGLLKLLILIFFGNQMGTATFVTMHVWEF